MRTNIIRSEWMCFSNNPISRRIKKGGWSGTWQGGGWEGERVRVGWEQLPVAAATLSPAKQTFNRTKYWQNRLVFLQVVSHRRSHHGGIIGGNFLIGRAVCVWNRWHLWLRTLILRAFFCVRSDCYNSPQVAQPDTDGVLNSPCLPSQQARPELMSSPSIPEWSITSCNYK